MAGCIFCRIAAHEEKADILWEDEKSICFLPRKTESFGHCLIIPKKHYADIFEIDAQSLACLSAAVKEVSKLLKDKTGADGINILHASGKVAGQSVGHFHIHLLPRFVNDGINAWPQMEEVLFNRDEFIKRIKK